MTLVAHQFEKTFFEELLNNIANQQSQIAIFFFFFYWKLVFSFLADFVIEKILTVFLSALIAFVSVLGRQISKCRPYSVPVNRINFGKCLLIGTGGQSLSNNSIFRNLLQMFNWGCLLQLGAIPTYIYCRLQFYVRTKA